MSRSLQDTTDSVQVRVHHPNSRPTLVYLPGLHGDWTLVGNFRRALAGRVCLVETAYPRTIAWSLDDYGAAVEAALAATGIDRAHVLAESYGSQVAWALVERGRFKMQSLILAGGFVRHPMRWGVRLARKMAGDVPMSVLTRILFGYARIARLRFRKSTEMAQELDEFIARRTDFDRHAATHRLRLIAENDPRSIASRTTVPVYALSGAIDPIVPWPPVHSWLRKHCPACRRFRVIGRADHNVLGTAPGLSADQVVEWIGERGAV